MVLCESSRSESSPGVCGLLEDVRDVLEEMEGPGVVGGEEGMGGGVTDTERCVVARCNTGREPQADEDEGSKRKSFGSKGASAMGGTVSM